MFTFIIEPIFIALRYISNTCHVGQKKTVGKIYNIGDPETKLSKLINRILIGKNLNAFKMFLQDLGTRFYLS